MSDVGARATEIVRDAFGELRRVLGFDLDQEQAVAAALDKAVMRAVQLGASEVAAQAIEKGVDLHLHTNIDIVDHDDLEP